MTARTEDFDADAIVRYLATSGRGPRKPKELARAMRVPTHRYKAFRALLARMEREGKLYRVKGKRYAVPGRINLVVGRLQTIRSGDAFVIPAEGGRDVFVPSAQLDTAMDGDQVVVRVEGKGRGGRPMGRVIRVLERSHPTIVGTYRQVRELGYVAPRDPRLGRDVLIPGGKEGGARNGDVVVASITAFGDRRLNPIGEVDRVLGPPSDPGVDVLSVLFGYRLPLEFPPEIDQAARDEGARAAAAPGPRREDHTDLHVFTIDPADAADHDDALSVGQAPGGHWEVGIHVADVSHFVEVGGVVDAEALRRGTSVYLVDRVVPMLPQVLSSDLCSLVPGRDRFAVSLFVTLDAEAGVRSHRFARTIIRSRHRLSYEQAEDVVQGRASLDAPTDDALRRLAELARVLLARRRARGSLDFDLPEARVVLDDEGVPVDIRRVNRLESHRLIEEFMLLANEVVARRAVDDGLPVLYRVHEPPDADRVEDLRTFLASIGYALPRKGLRPGDLQAILDRAEGRPEGALVSTVVLRAMSRARYDARNRGHFGLATRWYAHFTSPIRRYPDLVVHRAVVRAYVEERPSPATDQDALEAAAEHASERERVAQAAERDSVELKKAEFMMRHLGDEFDGTISGVTAFGFFVLLDDYFVEGLVHVSALADDYYVFHEERYSLAGERSGRRFRLGDRVRVGVARVDKEERRIDFQLVTGGSDRSP